jgi:hypothetical protein
MKNYVNSFVRYVTFYPEHNIYLRSENITSVILKTKKISILKTCHGVTQLKWSNTEMEFTCHGESIIMYLHIHLFHI